MGRFARALTSSFLLLPLASMSSGATTMEPERRPATERAVALWNEGRLDEAMAELESVIQAIEGGDEPDRDEKELEEAHILLGLLQLSGHDRASALESFARAGVDRRTASEWAETFTPELLRVYARMRAEGMLDPEVKPPPAPESEESGETRELMVGTRVRAELRGGGRPMVGSLAAVTDGNLVLVTKDRLKIELRRDGIRKLEVSSGRRGHPWMGFFVGAGAGALIGALAPLEGSCPASECYSRGESIGYGAVGIGALGALVGALIKTDRWLVVPPESIRVDVNGSRGGVGVQLVLSF